MSNPAGVLRRVNTLSRCISKSMARYSSTLPASQNAAAPLFDNRVEPRFVSKKLQGLFAQDRLEDAIVAVRGLKFIDYQANVVLWNLLIRESLQKKRFSLAYSLWQDMKKRGIRPTPLSYATYFTTMAHLSEIPDKAHENVKTLYAQWQKQIEEITEDPEELARIPPSQLTAPAEAYLNYLSHTVSLAAAMEAFYSLPTSGPFAPSIIAYTTIFRKLGSDPTASNLQAAESLWRSLTRSTSKVELDARIIGAYIQVLTNADKKGAAISIAEKHFSFSPGPGQAIPDAPALIAVLLLFLTSRQYNKGLDFVEPLMRRKPTKVQEELLTPRVYDIALELCAAKARSDLAQEFLCHQLLFSPEPPYEDTYTNAVLTCRQTANYPLARKILAHMIKSENLLPSEEAPLVHLNSHRRQHPPIAPKNKIITYFLQLINPSADYLQIHTCLKALMPFQHSFLAVPEVYGPIPPDHNIQRAPRTDPRTKFGLYWAWTCNQTLKKSIFWVRRRGSGRLTEGEKDDLRELDRLRKLKEKEIKGLLTLYRVRPERVEREVGLPDPVEKLRDLKGPIKRQKRLDKEQKRKERKRIEAEAQEGPDSKPSDVLFHTVVQPIANALG